MIDKVRQSVLYILNKDNNGYITPQEFNQYAGMAQLDIFNKYFVDYEEAKQLLKNGKASDNYADTVRKIEYNINVFLENILISKESDTATAIAAINAGTVSSIALANSGGGYSSAPNVFIGSSGSVAFAANTSVAKGAMLSSGTNYFIVITAGTTGANITSFDRNNNFTNGSAVLKYVTVSNGAGSGALATASIDTKGNISNIIITNAGSGYTSVPTVTIAAKSAGKGYALPSDWFFIDNLFIGNNEIQKVSPRELALLLKSPSVYPSLEFPVYNQKASLVEVYPSSIVSDIELNYIRYPKYPNWTYTSIANGEPIYNPSISGFQDFELYDEEFTKLVTIILQYAGVQIRETQVVQLEAQREAMLNKK